MEVQTLQALPVVLALELVAGESPPRLSLSRDEASELAALIATDLHSLVPQVDAARLALAGALFDQVELLRPGFPVWATLDELARRVPRGRLENVVAFGTHDGHMPAQPLEPSPAFADGPMRLMPLSLLVSEALVAELSQELEVQLVGRGEAGALTADWLMRTLGVRLEHVRYLSRNDLLALTCVQYEHVNLAPLWTLLETALLTPERTESVMSARGLGLNYAQGKVWVQSPAQWLAANVGDSTNRAHDFAGIMFELRQYAALLDAHQLGLLLQPLATTSTEAASGYLLETLGTVDPNGDAPMLFAHEAAGLGVVAITLSQRGAGARAQALAHGYPLHPQALGPLLTLLSERFGIDPELHAMGRILLDERGQLAAPGASVH